MKIDCSSYQFKHVSTNLSSVSIIHIAGTSDIITLNILSWKAADEHATHGKMDGRDLIRSICGWSHREKCSERAVFVSSFFWSIVYTFAAKTTHCGFFAKLRERKTERARERERQRERRRAATRHNYCRNIQPGRFWGYRFSDLLIIDFVTIHLLIYWLFDFKNYKV